jgi:tRNA-uridine 2-sulfurtransferase
MAGQRVVVAMSGGVDSSVVAALLVEQGFDVIGITLKTYAYEDVGGNTGNSSSCCSLDGINDARAVAAQLGIPHYVLDFSQIFTEEVVEDFVAEYMHGRTPNPCVVCNRKIKWEALIRKSEALGAGSLATGHYARVRHDPGLNRWLLSRGRDDRKDQSYALWGLTQDSLSRTMFPLAELTKEEVRSYAVRLGLPVAAKGESFEICFIPDNNYERFLKERAPDLEQRVQGGDLKFEGKTIGSHKGYPFFTIGQRKGLGVAVGEPLYVRRIDAGTNSVELGREEDLYARGLVARGLNLIKYFSIPDPVRVTAKVRYKDEGAPGTARTVDGGRLEVKFDERRRAITPGQSVVLYDGDDVIGGGIIDEVLE